MITTISEEYYRNLNPQPTLLSLDTLTVETAGGYTLPYLGYIECTLHVPFLGQQDIEVPALVVPSTEYNLKVPVVVGTNAIKLCRDMCSSNSEIPKEWQNAFVSFQQSRVGIVKSTDKCNVEMSQGRKKSWPDRDSNPGPLAYRASTLPTELPSHLVVL